MSYIQYAVLGILMLYNIDNVFGETGYYKQRTKEFRRMCCSSLTPVGKTETTLI
jgi:hypothetical protein